MQPSDRQPPEEAAEEHPGDTSDPASRPLYEFPAGGPLLYTAPPVAPPTLSPPVKRSRTWIWIVVAFFSLALLAVCGGCATPFDCRNVAQ
jgi:hypothetical protein